MTFLITKEDLNRAKISQKNKQDAQRAHLKVLLIVLKLKPLKLNRLNQE